MVTKKETINRELKQILEKKVIDYTSIIIFRITIQTINEFKRKHLLNDSS